MQVLLLLLLLLSHIQLFRTLWAVAHQVPLSMVTLQAGTLEKVDMPSSTVWTIREAQQYWSG